MMIPFLQDLIAVCVVGEWRCHGSGRRCKLREVPIGVLRALIQNFVDRRFLVAGARDDVLVVG